MGLKRSYSVIPTPEQIADIDFTDHSTLTTAVWGVNVAFLVLVAIIVALRMYTRACITRQFFADDILTVMAASSLFVSCAMALTATKYGLGQHVWNIPFPLSNILETVKYCVQFMFVAHVFYALATAFAKLSIITSYLRIFPNERLRITLYVTAAVVVGLGISAVCATIFQCQPIRAAWDFTIEDAKCYRFVDFLYANAAINIVTDFVICLAPLPCFWKLRIPVRQKLVVSFLFCIGFFACIVSIVRLAFLHDLEGIDITYNLVTPLNWTVIECSLGIICVSVPPMRPLLSRLIPNFLPTHLSAASGKSKGSRALQRTQEEVLEDMNRELDRQLREFGREAHEVQKPTTSTTMEEGSTVELTEMRGDEFHYGHHHHKASGSVGTFDFAEKK